MWPPSEVSRVGRGRWTDTHREDVEELETAIHADATHESWNRSTLPQAVGYLRVGVACVQAAEIVFELIASALAAGESGGEHHADVGQGGCWDAMGGGGGFAECVEE